MRICAGAARCPVAARAVPDREAFQCGLHLADADAQGYGHASNRRFTMSMVGTPSILES